MEVQEVRKGDVGGTGRRAHDRLCVHLLPAGWVTSLPLWLTLIIGESRVPVYISDHSDPRKICPLIGEIARRPDEKQDEWDAPPPKPSRLGSICETKDPASPHFGDMCVFDWRCQDCGQEEIEGVTYLREGKVVSICEKHVRPGDLRIDVVDARSVPFTPEEIVTKRRDRIKELHSKGLSTRQIADELHLSQSTVQYHLSRE